MAKPRAVEQICQLACAIAAIQNRVVEGVRQVCGDTLYLRIVKCQFYLFTNHMVDSFLPPT
jgi:hypothetical protein